MLATAVIMFREVLEAALIIAIVLGASRGIAGVKPWVFGGIGVGLFGASIMASLAAQISSFFSGVGQAYLNAAILLGAVVMLTWHAVWMSSHGHQLLAKASAIGEEARSGRGSHIPLFIIAVAAVMREGSEAVLFLWAIATGGANNTDMLMGGLGGGVGGVLVGILLYLGLLRIPVRHFFSITSWMLLLLTAGLAAQAAGFLNQADLLPSLADGVWDTSAILSQSSLAGQMLHILVGYIARPSGIEVVFYVGTLLTIMLLMRASRGKAPGAVSSGG